MKNLRIAAIVTCICIALVSLSPTCRMIRLIRSFDQIEQNAKKAITASQLQAWATNLLALYPSNATLRVSDLGTNFPQKLLELYPQIRPTIFIYEADSDTNSPRYLRLHWGSGFLGSVDFLIGPTNFVTSGHVWQPGVYFIRAG